jgi:hypothetical protein
MIIPRADAVKVNENKYIAIAPILLAQGPLAVRGKLMVFSEEHAIKLRETVYSADTLDEIALDLHTMVDKVVQGLRDQELKESNRI